MATNGLRIGIVGSGPAARLHADRFHAMDRGSLAGCVDVDGSIARGLANSLSTLDLIAPTFKDHAEILREEFPDALAIIQPDPSTDRPTIDSLASVSHVLMAGPLSLAGLARARGLKIGVVHHFRLFPSMIQARPILDDVPLCCPAVETLISDPLPEAIARSATIEQFVGLA